MSNRGRRLLRSAAVGVLAVAAVVAVWAAIWRVGEFRGGGRNWAVAQTRSNVRSNATATPFAPQRRYKICAWSRGSNASLQHAIAADAIDEIDLDWYHSRPDGSLRAQGQDMTLVGRAHAAGIEVYATITNRQSHATPFDGGIAAAILSSPSARASQIRNLVRLCTRKGFDGIDVDWEELGAADRARFVSFLKDLAKQLHRHRKWLSIAVYPKAVEPGFTDAQKAEDYRAIGSAVDEMKVMTYAHSGGWTAPGAQMPLYWARQVMDFARKQVATGKLYMGLPFFGFDWQGSSARYVPWKDVAAARAKYGGRLGRDAQSGEAVLRYTDAAGVAHVACYQDRVAVRTKLTWMKRKEAPIAGVAIWVMGGEDAGFWKILAAQLPRE